MWHTRYPARPRCWWQQLERQPRYAMPFAHLFPRPPDARAPRGGEADRLVRELTRRGSPEPSLEEIVHEHTRETVRRWEPVETWQVVSIARLDEQEHARWGADGAQVVEWFDRGDLASWEAPSLMETAPARDPRTWRRVMARIRRWFQPPERWELAGAEH